MKTFHLSLAGFSIVLFLALKKGKETNPSSTQLIVQSIQKSNEPILSDTGKIENIAVPDFSNPELTRFYKAYTTHTLQCVQAIRAKDAVKINALFEDGRQFDDKLQKMEQRARSNAGDDDKFKALLRKLLPYQMEIVRSPYYKKFTEDHHIKQK
jgi:hypothetical protein